MGAKIKLFFSLVFLVFLVLTIMCIRWTIKEVSYVGMHFDTGLDIDFLKCQDNLKNKELGCECTSGTEYGYCREVSVYNKTKRNIQIQNALKIQKKRRETAKKCYDAGKSYRYEYDLLKDYNYTCEQIQYLNDHFVDMIVTKDGGYISGSYRGFLSSGSLSGKFNNHVVTKILATGKLIEEHSYHKDCANITHNEKIDYYEENDFIMYYVKNCIGEA